MQSIKVMAIGNGINYSNSDYSATKTLTTQVFDSNYYGGGKNGKSMLTIGVKTWTYGAPEETQ